MAVVHLRARLGGSADDLLGAVDERLRRQLDQVARVREGRDASLRCQRGHPQVLIGVRARRVADHDADTERAIGQVGGEASQDGADLVGRGGSLPGRCPMLARKVPIRPSRTMPPTASIRASAQDAAKP